MGPARFLTVLCVIGMRPARVGTARIGPARIPEYAVHDSAYYCITGLLYGRVLRVVCALGVLSQNENQAKLRAKLLCTKLCVPNCTDAKLSNAFCSCT